MRRLLPLISLCLAAMPLPARAASRPALVLTGSRTASMLVTFRHPLTLSNGDPARGEAAPTITGNADLAGYLLADSSGRHFLAGVVTTTRVKPQNVPARFMIGDRTVRIPAGRYLLTLIASAATQVRVPASGPTADLTYRPQKAVPVRIKDLPLSPAAGTSMEGRTPVTVGWRTVTLFGVSLTSTGLGGNGSMCLTEPGSRCPGYVTRLFAYAPVPPPDILRRHSFAGLALPADVGPGRYDIAWSVSVDGVGTDVRGLAITVG